jgi:hypothetical protein
MKITESDKIIGLKVIDLEIFRDHRGEFVETYHQKKYTFFDDNNKLYIRAYNYIDHIPDSKCDEYGYQLEMQDKDTYHWHFLSDYQVETSIEKIKEKLYPVTFGPFLGGIVKSNICNDFCANHGLLVRKNPNIHEWIKEFYPEYINSDYLDQDSKITMDIYRRENNKYWEEVKTNYLSNLNSPQ